MYRYSKKNTKEKKHCKDIMGEFMLLGIILTVLSPYTSVIVACLVLINVLRKKYEIELNPINIGLVILFFISIISGIYNKSTYSILGSSGILLFFAISIYLQNKLTSLSKIESFIENVWKVSFVAGLIGIFEKFISLYVDMTWTSKLFFNGPYTPSVEHYRIYSTFGNPNVTGAWFASMVLISIYFFGNREGKRKLFCFLSICVFVLGLIFSGSKGATMGLEAGILIYLVLNKNFKNRIVMLTIFVMVLSLALLSPEITHPLNSRDTIWSQAFKLFLDNPITGGGMFGVYEQTQKVHAHNIWLSILSMFGAFGILTYFWFKLYMYKGLIFCYKHEPTLTALLAAIHGTMLVHGFVDFVMMTPQGGIMFFSSMSLITALSKVYSLRSTVDSKSKYISLNENYS